MPKTPMKYENTIMYKIVCKDLNIKELYVGHTTNWTKRKCSHKSDCCNENSKHYHLKIYKTIREYGGWENWDMIEIEKYSCNDKNEARKRERFWYEDFNAQLNSVKPYATFEEIKERQKEHQKNRPCRKEQRKEYLSRPEIKEHVKERNKEYYSRPEIKEHIKEYQKEYLSRPENKERMREHRKEYLKEYYQENKEHTREYRKEQGKKYRQENKEKISKQKAEKVVCECSSVVSRSNISFHLKTKKHIEYMDTKL